MRGMKTGVSAGSATNQKTRPRTMTQLCCGTPLFQQRQRSKGPCSARLIPPFDREFFLRVRASWHEFQRGGSCHRRNLPAHKGLNVQVDREGDSEIHLKRRLPALARPPHLAARLPACTNSSYPSASSTTSTKLTVQGRVPLSVPSWVDVRKNDNMVNCGEVEGGWSAGGTVKISSGHPATYDVTVPSTSTQATD
jgi:hypothetical protein